jgi:hypothetical protein
MPLYQKLLTSTASNGGIRLGRSTASEESMPTVLGWIDEYSKNHPACMLKGPLAGRPARIIDVGTADDFSDIYLCLDAELDRGYKFITLSYCWGNPVNVVTLLRASIDAFRRQIPFNTLPRTIRDAIAFTRRLIKAYGIRYIWIDSLCIVQDSDDDKTRELALMGDI